MELIFTLAIVFQFEYLAPGGIKKAESFPSLDMCLEAQEDFAEQGFPIVSKCRVVGVES